MSGNEHLDPAAALASPPTETRSSYTARDLALYALGVGAGADPLDPTELASVYELHGPGFVGLPTYGVVPAVNAVLTLAMEGTLAAGLHFGLERILHGEQYLLLHRPLPTQASLTHRVRVTDVFDKGKNAVVVVEIKTFEDATGAELVHNELSMVVRGAGGWGGERGPAASLPPPERPPDAVVEERIPPGQALLYRLSGDWNPLHVDPEFARAFGFERPILHGLCTFGYVGRAALKAFAGNDGRRFKSIRVRFAQSVYPGETLRTELWQEPGGRVLLRALVKERSVVVIDNAAVELLPAS